MYRMALIGASILASASIFTVAQAQGDAPKSYDTAVAYLKNSFEKCKGGETKKGPEIDLFCGCVGGTVLTADILKADSNDPRLVALFTACMGATGR